MGDTDGMMVTRRFAACATGGASSWLSEVLTLTSLDGTSAHCAITSCHQCGTSFFEYFVLEHATNISGFALNVMIVQIDALEVGEFAGLAFHVGVYMKSIGCASSLLTTTCQSVERLVMSA